MSAVGIREGLDIALFFCDFFLRDLFRGLFRRDSIVGVTVVVTTLTAEFLREPLGGISAIKVLCFQRVYFLSVSSSSVSRSLAPVRPCGPRPAEFNVDQLDGVILTTMLRQLRR